MESKNNIKGITLYRFIGWSLFLILPIALIFSNNSILFLTSLIIVVYLTAFWTIKSYEITSKGIVIKYLVRFYNNTRVFNFENLEKATFIYENGTFAEPRLILESKNLREVIVIINFHKVKNFLERLQNHEVPIFFQTTDFIIKKRLEWPYYQKDR